MLAPSLLAPSRPFYTGKEEDDTQDQELHSKENSPEEALAEEAVEEDSLQDDILKETVHTASADLSDTMKSTDSEIKAEATPIVLQTSPTQDTTSNSKKVDEPALSMDHQLLAEEKESKKNEVPASANLQTDTTSPSTKHEDPDLSIDPRVAADATDNTNDDGPAFSVDLQALADDAALKPDKAGASNDKHEDSASSGDLKSLTDETENIKNEDLHSVADDRSEGLHKDSSANMHQEKEAAISIEVETLPDDKDSKKDEDPAFSVDLQALATDTDDKEIEVPAVTMDLKVPADDTDRAKEEEPTFSVNLQALADDAHTSSDKEKASPSANAQPVSVSSSEQQNSGAGTSEDPWHPQLRRRFLGYHIDESWRNAETRRYDHPGFVVGKASADPFWSVAGFYDEL